MKPLVSLVRAEAYGPAELDRALAEALELAGPPEVRGASVLLKPNLLNASAVDKAVTTHPEVIRAAIRAMRRLGASRILVGDSPAWQSTESVGLKTGAKDAAESEGAEWTDFSEGVEYECPEGGLVKRFTLAKALKESEVLVSLPKLKTHGLMYYTGAVKNLFGLVPGYAKSAFHLRFPGRTEFAGMLADLALCAKPRYAIMDAVVGMEGPGPGNGRPKRLGLLLASSDSLALDMAASALIGYDPAAVPYIPLLAGRGGFVPSFAEVETVGLDPAAAKPGSFELIPVLKETDFFKKRLPAWAHRLVRDCTVARPVFDHGRCVRCGGCVRICPAKALELRPGPEGGKRIEIDYEACIRCYCCHEICPEDAIRLVRGPRLRR